MDERRTARRYPLTLAVKYQIDHGLSGTGTVVDMTARSARLHLDRRVPILTNMRLHIEWPAKVNNSVALRLRTDARVIRADERHTVVVFKGYDFVIAGKQATLNAAAVGNRERHQRRVLRGIV